LRGPARRANPILRRTSTKLAWHHKASQIAAVEMATLSWVDWFNNRHLMEPIGNIPPAEAEARYCAMQEAMPMAA
jgi:transposase InsO family protein